MIIIGTILLLLSLHEVAHGRPQGTADEEDCTLNNKYGFDFNCDGMVSAEEIIGESYKTDEKDKSAIRLATTSITKFDADNDGLLNEEEFLLWFDTDYYYSTENKFKSYDFNGDSKVSAEEIRDFNGDDDIYNTKMKILSMAMFDVDEDGLLDEDEFLPWVDYEYSPEFEFKSYDANGDKKVSAKEIIALEEISDEEEIKAFLAGDDADNKRADLTTKTVFTIAEFDNDGDGMINEEEFQLYFETNDPYDFAYQRIEFRVMDTNGDKSIQSGEYRKILKIWGYADEVIERRTMEHFKEFDTNNNKEWDLEEFSLWWDSPNSEIEVQEDFNSTDRDGNHVISEEEWKMDTISIGAPELTEVDLIQFKEDDSNKDGNLSYSEYAAAYNFE